MEEIGGSKATLWLFVLLKGISYLRCNLWNEILVAQPISHHFSYFKCPEHFFLIQNH